MDTDRFSTRNHHLPLYGLYSVSLFAALFIIGSAISTDKYALAFVGSVVRADPNLLSTPVSTSSICSPAWSVVDSPSPGAGRNDLTEVTALSARDAWAVGYADTMPYTGRLVSLIEHWDGAQWTQFPSPNPGSRTNQLYGVDAVAADDIWAVGYWENNSGFYALIMHWDGLLWTVMPVPQEKPLEPEGMSGLLYAVDAVSADDVWAVGSTDSGTLTMHWNGDAWSVVPSPGDGTLFSVVGISEDDVWAVGYGYGLQTLTMHWDGSSWKVVPSPNIGKQANALLAVDAASTADVWAVGYYQTGITTTQALVLHWEGAEWAVFTAPNPGNQDNSLHGVEVISADDVWAVGYFADSYPSPYRTLTLHWDGTSWQQAPSPDGTVAGISAVSSDDIWAVGGGSQRPTLAIRYVGRVSFDDVYPGHTFYEPVRYLYCASVVTGYSDNTYRPNSSTTRAQLTKMVVLAEPWELLNPDTPTFSDVPRGSPFYQFIETAAERGVIAGYACGNPEPCDPQQRPYFRPNYNVTRAQVARMIVLAEGWPIETPPDQTFTDVDWTSPFRPYVETAAIHGIITGYPCGNPEPCSPQNLPYFRPGNPTTRGQAAKIIYYAVTAP